MKVYTLVFDSYSDALKAIRKLRKRGVSLYTCILIIGTNHHNKVKDFLKKENVDRKIMVFIL